MLLESQRQHSHAASPRPPAYPSPPPSFSPFSSSSTDLRNLSSSSSLSSSLSSSTSFSSSSSSVVSFSGVSASLSLIHPRLGSNPMPSFGVPESIVARRIERSFLLPWVRGAVLVLRHSLQLTGEMQSLYPLADMIFACLLDRRRRRPHGYSLLEALPHGVILEALQSLCLLRYHRRRASDFDLLLECLAGLPSPLLALDKGGALALWTAYDILRYEGGASISWRMGSIPTRRGRNPLADAVKIQPSDLHKLFVSFKRDCQDIALDVSAHFKRYRDIERKGGRERERKTQKTRSHANSHRRSVIRENSI
ncbi:transmembrane protein [Cystoisospora suis]|uniref:Transmembrane protein n=1 Tax=Cystoisospora suis TaxID=483139 RepID=A0A2C6KF42_9APIC|nr:transmembrane protein [Cystoisospora suis]